MNKMILGSVLFVVFVLFALRILAQNTHIGIFDNPLDIGQVGISGSVSYHPEDQEYLMEGSGDNMWLDL